MLVTSPRSPDQTGRESGLPADGEHQQPVSYCTCTETVLCDECTTCKVCCLLLGECGPLNADGECEDCAPLVIDPYDLL